MTDEPNRLRNEAERVRREWAAGRRVMLGSEEEAQLIEEAASYGRDVEPPYRAIEADVLEAKALAVEEAERRLHADAELLAKLVELLIAAAMFEPYDYWSDLARCIADPPGGPTVSQARQAQAIAREVVPADADGRHLRADMLGAAAHELAYHEVSPAHVRDMVVSGTVTIEGLARRGTRDLKPAYNPTQEEWDKPMLVEVPHHVARQMYLSCQFERVGLPRQGRASWRQVGDSETSRVFEVYDLSPPMPESDEQIRIATIRDRGAKLHHPGLRESDIE